MTSRLLEERVANLESELAEVKAAMANGTEPKDWRRTIGMFTDDPGMQEVFRVAMKIRDADRRRARRHALSRRRRSRT